MSLVARRPRFELLLEKLQIVDVHVRNSPVVKVRVSPVQKLISLACYGFRSLCFVPGCCNRGTKFQAMIAAKMIAAARPSPARLSQFHGVPKGTARGSGCFLGNHGWVSRATFCTGRSAISSRNED